MRSLLRPAQKTNWETPDDLLSDVRRLGGGRIALDPCTVSYNPTGADAFIAPPRDGLGDDWLLPAGQGLVFCNPPSGRALQRWTAKIAAEAKRGVEVVALLPARTDTRWWTAVTEAQAWCFLRGRLRFQGAQWSATFPSVLCYWGPRPGEFRRIFGPRGWCLIRVNESELVAPDQSFPSEDRPARR